MNDLILIKPREEYIDEIRDYQQEFLDDGSAFAGDSGLSKFGDISAWINQCRLFEKKETLPNPDWVEADQYMLVRKTDNRILGMINFRHYLNDYLAERGGHIGYGVRPSERQKGYAKTMLALCLDKCREYGLEKVLITCDQTNEASRRTIIACGGVFEQIVKAKDKTFEQYWISLDPLRLFYNNYNENDRLMPKHGQVEFLTTMHYIKRCLSPDARILEIGAGTGRYSRTIANMGYKVDALELIESNIDIFRQNINPKQNITITQGNALDLSAFDDNTYDMTLLLGPMYHLFTEEDKHKALSEALRVTKLGGVVFVAYCISDASLVSSGFGQKKFDIAQYLERGKIDPKTFCTFSVPEDIFEMVRKEDIDRLNSKFNVRRLHYIASDMFANFIPAEIDEMNDETFKLYMRYHLAVCERSDMVGVTHHSLDIIRKN